MRVTVGVVGEGRPEAEALSLRDALLSDPALRSVRVQEQFAGAKPGEMGSLGEVALVVLGAGGVGSMVVQALCNWLAGRRIGVRLVLSRDGDTVEIDVPKARNYQEVASLCQRFGVSMESERESEGGREA
ncbi:effector-associated constant component EACC1 [Streptomyces cellulosae]